MTAIETTETEVSELQICQEIGSLNSQITELQSHLASLKNQPTYELSPQNLTPTEVIQLAKKVAVGEQKAALQHTEAKAISQVIVSLEAQVSAKRREMGELKSKKSFDRLMGLATEYNTAIDASVRVLEQIRVADRELRQQGHQAFEVTSADLMELPYCSIRQNSVKLRRRYDVLRES